MSFVQSGVETGSASCVSAFRHRPLLASNHIDENHAEPASSCARAVVATREEMVEPRAWGNFLIRRQRVIEEVVMPRPAASRAPRLADVDRPGAVRRLNTCGMKISLTRSVSFHIKRWQNKQARFRQSYV
jgi:hypothetical protein